MKIIGCAVRFLVLVISFFMGVFPVLGLAEASQSELALSIGTATPGSVPHIMGSLMSEFWKKYANISVSVEPIGGADAVVRATREKRIDIGIGNAYSIRLGYMARNQFAGEKKADMLRAIMLGHISTRALVARADRGIKTPADLLGKKVQARRRALLDLEESLTTVLKVYGVPKEKVTVLQHSNTKEQSEALVLGTADAGFFPCGVPTKFHPLMQKLARSVDIVVVPLDREKRDKVLEMLGPAFIPIVVHKGAVKGHDRDVLGIGIPMAVWVRSDMPEETAYKLTKAVLGHSDEFKKGHAHAKYYSLENTMQPPPIPFHPGAIKHFKEAGAWTPQLDKIQKQRLEEK